MFCKRVREEALRWEKRHNDALKGHYTNRKDHKAVPWPEIPLDFEEWEPKTKRATKKD